MRAARLTGITVLLCLMLAIHSVSSHAAAWEYLSGEGIWRPLVAPAQTTVLAGHEEARVVWLGAAGADSVIAALRERDDGAVSLWRAERQGLSRLTLLPDGIAEVYSACVLADGTLWVATDRGLLVQSGARGARLYESVEGLVPPMLRLMAGPPPLHVTVDLTDIRSLLPCTDDWGHTQVVGAYVAAMSPPASPDTVVDPTSGVFAVLPDLRTADLQGIDGHAVGVRPWLVRTPGGEAIIVQGSLGLVRHLDPRDSADLGGSGHKVFSRDVTVVADVGAVQAKQWLEQDGGRHIRGALFARGSVCAVYAGQSEAGLLLLEGTEWRPQPLPTGLLEGVPEFTSWAWDGAEKVFVGTQRHGALVSDLRGWNRAEVEALPRPGADGPPTLVAWNGSQKCLWLASGARVAALP